MRAPAVGLVIALLGGCWPAPGQTTGTRRRVSSPIAFYNDADPSAAGMLNVSEYYSYHRVLAGHDTAFPSTYLSLGLHRRVDVSGGVGWVQSQFEESRIDGIGDTYFGAKVLLVEEKGRRPAFAINPQIEVLGRASVADNPLAPDRVNFVFPAVLQKSLDYYRIYSMTGYVTRGIVFSSLVGELNRWNRVTPVVILSHSRLTTERDLISQLGLNRSRSDVTGGVAVSPAPNWTLFANTGRSFGRRDLNSTRYQFTFGVSFNVRLWGKE